MKRLLSDADSKSEIIAESENNEIKILRRSNSSIGLQSSKSIITFEIDNKNELSIVELKIKDAEEQIGKVNVEIDEAESQIKTCVDSEEKKYLFNKVDKLRDEKNKLRDKENKLRDKENKLRDEKNKLRDEKNMFHEKEMFLLKQSSQDRKNNVDTRDIVVIPNDICFSIEVPDVSHSYETTSHNLIAVNESLSEAIETIQTFAVEATDPGGSFRVPPLVMSRMARGGKSTFLRLLFEKLKTHKLNGISFYPILINFNYNFMRYYGESNLDSILRLIAMQLIPNEVILQNKGKEFKCHESELLKYIDETSQGQPVVLLIDELNTLAFPIEAKASMFLKQEFLDKKNRYLVYSSHLPFDVDVDVLAVTSNSDRGYISVIAPICYDLETLRSMDSRTSALTWLETYLYGGIPSLIFAAKSNIYTPEDRFMEFRSKKLVLPESQSEKRKVLGNFVNEVLTGDRCSKEYRMFDTFSTWSFDETLKTKKIKWPLCYICGVCKIDFFCAAAKEISELIASITCYSKQVKSGKDWEGIVIIAIALHCLNASLNGECKLFGLCEESTFPNFEIVNIPHDYATLSSSEAWIKEKLSKSKSNSLKLFVPSDVCFNICDALLAYKDSDSVSKLIGFQMKLGNGKVNTKVKLPEFVETVYVIRGKENEEKLSDKFTFLTGKEVMDLLGYSLGDLYPNIWNK